MKIAALQLSTLPMSEAKLDYYFRICKQKEVQRVCTQQLFQRVRGHANLDD